MSIIFLFQFFAGLYLQPLLLLWLWTVYWSSGTATYPDFRDVASIVTYVLLLIALFLHILVFSYMLHYTLRFTQNISFITVEYCHLNYTLQPIHSNIQIPKYFAVGKCVNRLSQETSIHISVVQNSFSLFSNIHICPIYCDILWIFLKFTMLNYSRPTFLPQMLWPHNSRICISYHAFLITKYRRF